MGSRIKGITRAFSRVTRRSGTDEPLRPIDPASVPVGRAGGTVVAEGVASPRLTQLDLT